MGEIFYDAAVRPWLRVSGHVQYSHPAVAGFPDATFVGVGTWVRF